MKGPILCKYMISKIPDSDSDHFISMVNSCESQGAFVPNMLLGALVGRLFGGLLESMHLQVEVLDEKLKRWYTVHASFEDMSRYVCIYILFIYSFRYKVMYIYIC